MDIMWIYLSIADQAGFRIKLTLMIYVMIVLLVHNLVWTMFLQAGLSDTFIDAFDGHFGPKLAMEAVYKSFPSS